MNVEATLIAPKLTTHKDVGCDLTENAMQGSTSMRNRD